MIWNSIRNKGAIFFFFAYCMPNYLHLLHFSFVQHYEEDFIAHILSMRKLKFKEFK